MMARACIMSWPVAHPRGSLDVVRAVVRIISLVPEGGTQRFSQVPKLRALSPKASLPAPRPHPPVKEWAPEASRTGRLPLSPPSRRAICGDLVTPQKSFLLEPMNDPAVDSHSAQLSHTNLAP